MLNVLVIFGGCSEEHEVAVKSAIEVYEHMDTKKYNVIYVCVTKDGCWVKVDNPKQSLTECDTMVLLSSDKSKKGVFVLKDNVYTFLPIDVILPVMHGKMGEDGQLQGLMKMSGIPFVGCDIEASVIGMDKALANMVADRAGVNVPWFMASECLEEINPDILPYPVFVKPARSGSSFGISKVTECEQYQAAVKEALKYDSKIIIEEAIEGVEVGCAVLGNGKNLITGEVDLIQVNKGFFRIHQEENPNRDSENAVIKVPAPLEVEVTERIKNEAKKVYAAMGCEGLARVDMFYTSDGKIILNEVNTLPGLTSYSRYPAMMKAAGIDFGEMIQRLIQLAIDKK